MSSLIDSQLQHREDTRRVRPPNILYASGLTGPCLQKTYLQLTHDRPHTIETLRIFNAGNILEDYWAGVLEAHPDIDVIATQLRARHNLTVNDEEWSIHGRADILAHHHLENLVLHEVKTAKSSTWRREPSPDHVAQLQFYLNVLQIDLGQVDYLDKSAFLQGRTAIDKSFPVKRSLTAFTDFIDVATKIIRSLQDGIPPAANPDAWNGKICGYCDYRDLCGGKDSDF